MPMVDYAEWYRRQRQAQQAQQQPQGVPGATGSLINPGYAPVGYQPESWKEQRGELLDTGKGALTGAIKGASAGASAGPKGALIGAAIGGTLGAAQGLAKGGREAWDAAKAGDTQGFYRNLMPFIGAAGPAAPLMALGLIPYKILPKKYNPATIPVKAIQELFGGPQTKIEEKRWDRLKRYGFEVPKWVSGDRNTKFDVIRADLPPDYVGYDKDGNWVNNKFARSRSEADLTAGDLNQSAAMAESFGTLWNAASDESKKAIGNLALNANQVREQKGTLDIAWDKDTYARAQQILDSDPGVQKAIQEMPDQYALPDYQLPWNRK